MRTHSSHRWLRVLAVLLICWISQECFPQSALESTTRLEYGFETGVTTNYIWRGFADYSGASWQTTVRMNYGRFGASCWSEIGQEAGSTLLNREDDLEVHYSSNPIHGITLTGGYTAYFGWYANSIAHELSFSASRGKRSVGSIAVYQNVGNQTGTYLSASLARDFQFSKRWSVQLNGALGFNRRMYVPENTFSDLTLNAVFSRPTQGPGRISPTVGVSKSLNSRFFANRIYAGFVFSIHSPD